MKKMKFLLTSNNAYNYLVEHGLCDLKTQPPIKIESKSSKNFNLLLSFTNHRYLLLKQEYHWEEDEISNEFLQEWRFYQWLKTCSEISHIKTIFSEAIHFDPINSIMIFNYLNNYCDLEYFYSQYNKFDPKIAEEIGVVISTLHKLTFDREDYKQTLFSENHRNYTNPNYLIDFEKIRPEIFANITYENIKFFKLYQRYESFQTAINQLQTTYQSRCLIHKDLKLNNILLHNQWQEMISKQKSSPNSMIKIIDWEKCRWGDPAFDIGKIIASYLDHWLSSLLISTDIDLETALRLAKTPLQTIHPSINALLKTYYHHFPEILIAFPDFITRVIQFTGLALLEQMQVNIEDHQPFGNIGICTLQVAKNLLCFPKQSSAIIFGTTIQELQNQQYSTVY